MNVTQNYMGRGWTYAERAEARSEPILAHPQWEREGVAEVSPGPNQYCPNCEVRWRGQADPEISTQCWLCAGYSEPYDWQSQCTPERIDQEYDYQGNPSIPGGCRCSDDLPGDVAILIERGEHLHLAARHAAHLQSIRTKFRGWYPDLVIPELAA